MVRTDEAVEEAVRREAVGLIKGLDTIDLSHFTVVGSYTRFNEHVRQTLNDARVRIANGWRARRRRENHLIWAAPGSGKTYFVEQIAAANPQVEFVPINLAKLDESRFREELGRVMSMTQPTLTLIDEIDAQPDATWPYDVLFPCLDVNLNEPKMVVFVLAGSSGESMEQFKARIGNRPKGPDLLTRIPHTNDCTIAPMDAGDRIIVAVTQMLNAAAEAGRPLRQVEKLALLYVATAPKLANPRQLREFVVRGVSRVPVDDDRIKYDDLFDSGDLENKSFWLSTLADADALASVFVLVDGEVPPRIPDARNHPGGEGGADVPLLELSGDLSPMFDSSALLDDPDDDADR